MHKAMWWSAAGAAVILWLGFASHLTTVSAQQAPGQGGAGGGQAAGGAAAMMRGPAITPEMRAKIEAGNGVFQQKCAFCHGRDAGGGETGPDLTRSKLVIDDTNGDKIPAFVRTGKEGRMPPFDLPPADMDGIVAFLHEQHRKAVSTGQRKGVDVADLQTGNAEAGKQYFEGAGGCAKCHSATGDLAHVATKYQGLQLEMRMLYPRGAKSKATITAAPGFKPGETVTGTVAYRDEWTLALTTADGSYYSWPTDRIKYTIDDPAGRGHAAQFPKYTDDDIHNLMAYMQTLR